MKQLLDGISNQHLAQFTVLLGSLLQAKKAAGRATTFNLTELADHASKLATFSDDRSVNLNDLKISDSNRDAVLAEAKASAEAYSLSRNKRTQPKSFIGSSAEEKKIMSDVKDWLARRRLRGHGTRINND